MSRVPQEMNDTSKHLGRWQYGKKKNVQIPWLLFIALFNDINQIFMEEFFESYKNI